MLFAPVAGRAQSDDEAETAAWSTTGLVLGLKAGAGIGAPLSELGPTFVGEVELGYALPLPEPIGRSLELFTAGAYLAPATEGRAAMADPRLPGDGTFTYEVTARAVVLTLGARYRVPLAGETIAPYLAAGGRLYLLRTEIEGEVSGQALGATDETASTFGLHLGAGVDIRFGPGALLIEAQLGYAPLDGYVMRDTNAGALVLLAGYRFMPFERAAKARREAGVAPPPEPVLKEEPVEPAPPPVDPTPADAPEPAAAPKPPADAPEPSAAEAAPPVSATPAPPAEGQGTIQGNIRSFDGSPLQSTVTVYPVNVKTTTNAEGAFELNLKPGRYTVRLRAYGYRSQNRTVIVHENGVTVLNAELRKK
jgi:hypothetical protein